MNNSIKRAQSQARLSFAERVNFRPKVRQYKKLMMTLALLLTAVTGAWADETPLVTITIGSDGNPVYSAEGLVTLTGTNYAVDDTNGKYYWFPTTPFVTMSATVAAAADNVSITKVVFWSTDTDNGDYNNSLEDTAAPYLCYADFLKGVKSLSDDFATKVDDYNISKVEVYGTAETIDVIPVAEPAANTQQWTFKQPGSNVVLTPIYSAATIYDADGQTEKMAYETLKEAIQNVQNGETIVLDWDVTFTEKDEPIETSLKGNGVIFTLDLNGHTIDGRELDNPCIVLNNDNDQMTITDSSTDQTGGIKGIPPVAEGAIIFDGGRYFLGTGVDAEYLKTNWDEYSSDFGWQLAEGKEFIDLEGGADDNDGFTLRVDYAAFELTIGAGRFATFYDTHNITMIEENQNISFYTIKKGDIDLDNNVAKVTKVENAIIPAGLPLLVYNGGQQQQTVKLKATTTEATPIPGIAIEFVGTASGRKFYDVDMAAYDYYALSGGKMFVPVYETGTIAPHKCWIQFLKQQGGSRSIMLVFEGDATAISTVSGSPADTGDIYDLQGPDPSPTGEGRDYNKNNN